eukprot:469561_1
MLHRVLNQFACLTSIKCSSPFTRRICTTPLFDAQKHLLPYSDEYNIKTHQLSSLGYSNIDFDNSGIIDFGYTEPFQLLTEECIDIIRNEVLSNDIIDNCYYSSQIAPLVIRRPNKYSKFLYDLFHSKELIDMLNKITNTTLRIHPMQFEQAQCNIQSKQNQNVFDWHYDSQDFVLIIMLSDIPSNAIGGGTLLEYYDHDQNITKYKELLFSNPGTAYFMQSNQVRHAANYAQNYIRITMVTSYMYDNITNHDPSSITIAKYYTDHKELMNEYLDYRLDDLINKTQHNKDKYKLFDSEMSYNCLINNLKMMQKDLNVTIKSIEEIRDYDNNNRPKKLNP